MIEAKKLVVVLPAYNAEKTLVKTYENSLYQACLYTYRCADFTRLALDIAAQLGESAAKRWFISSSYARVMICSKTG